MKGAGAPRLSHRIAQTPQLIGFQSVSIMFMKLNITASKTQRSMGRTETSRRHDTSPAWRQILLLADILKIYIHKEYDVIFDMCMENVTISTF